MPEISHHHGSEPFNTPCMEAVRMLDAAYLLTSRAHLVKLAMQVRAKVPFALDFAFLTIPSSAEAAVHKALIGDMLSVTLAKHRQEFDDQ
jgi:hypothetical protein